MVVIAQRSWKANEGAQTKKLVFGGEMKQDYGVE
jgi:hypothetical protein